MGLISFDRKLWFTMKGCKGKCKGKHYFIENAHTFIGRMLAYCPHTKEYFLMSKFDIIKMSNESKYWLKGFLSGAEPEPPDENPKNNKYLFWEKSIKRFHQTGAWAENKRRCKVCRKQALFSEFEHLCSECRKENRI